MLKLFAFAAAFRGQNMNKWWSFPHKNPTEMKPPAEFFPRLGDDIKWGWIWILILGNARKGHYLAFSIASRMLWMNEPSHTSSVAAFIPKVGIFQSDSYCRLHCNRLDEAHTLNWRYVVHLGNHIFHWARWVKGKYEFTAKTNTFSRLENSANLGWNGIGLLCCFALCGWERKVLERLFC